MIRWVNRGGALIARARRWSVPIAAAFVLTCAGRVTAQDASPPRLPFFVVDLHANVPRFPSDSQPLADSRNLGLGELPGTGLGGDVGVHIYPFKWRAVTFGLGGQFTSARATQTLDVAAAAVGFRPVTERFTSLAPQVSLNFGSGTGWSYLSGGVSVATWSIVPDGSSPLPIDGDRLKTINYGGGARWFAKRHLAFSFDVRFYAINPGAPSGSLPGSPRTTLLIFGAGVSLK